MPNWIGDFLMALAVVRRKSRESPSDLTIIIPEKLKSLGFLVNDYPTELYVRSSGEAFRSTVSRVKNENFDKMYILPHSFSSAYFAFRTGIKRRRGLKAEARSLLLTDRVEASFATRAKHLTREYSYVLETEYVSPEVWEGAELELLNGLSSEIVLCPGAAYGPSKKWRGYAELVKNLADREFIILGSQKDRGEADLITSVSPDRVRNMAGRTSLEEAFSIIASASAVVSNDSGLMHAAGYLGTPVVGIYGSTSPDWTRPLGKNVRIARSECDCTPCFKRECVRTDDLYRCQKEISASTVAELLDQIIRK